MSTTYIPLGPRALTVTPQEDYTLLVEFNTGELSSFDVRPLLNNGVFSALSNPKLFMQAHQKAGTAVWNEDLDITPEIL